MCTLAAVTGSSHGLMMAHIDVKIIGTTISLSARTHKAPMYPTSLTAAGDASHAWQIMPTAKPMVLHTIVSAVSQRERKPLRGIMLDSLAAIGLTRAMRRRKWMDSKTW